MSTSRSGFSLVEIAIASAIGVTLLCIVISLTAQSAATILGTERHIEAMHVAQLNLERIEFDLQRLLLRTHADLRLLDRAQLSADHDSIAWFTAETGPSGRDTVYQGRPVEYRAVASGAGLFHLLRNGTALPAALFRRLQMKVEQVAAFVPGRKLYFVRTTAVGLDLAQRKEFQLEVLTAVDAMCGWSGREDWNPNPDLEAPVLGFEPGP